MGVEDGGTVTGTSEGTGKMCVVALFSEGGTRGDVEAM